MAQHVSSQLQAGAHPIPCPAFRCGAALPEDACHALLAGSGRAEEARQLQQAAGLRCGRLLACPLPGCGHVQPAAPPGSRETQLR
jgi:hypothetical protein